MASVPTTYQIRMTFRVPLPFAFAWCTDYTANDRKLEGDAGSRQILQSGKRGAVFEDLNPTPHGWMWSRYTVTLQPPDRWHATATGNYRTWKLNYSLRALPGDRTEFTLRGRRRATPLGVKNPPKRVLESELRSMWGNLRRALEKDYRAHRTQPPR